MNFKEDIEKISSSLQTSIKKAIKNENYNEAISLIIALKNIVNVGILSQMTKENID